MDIIAAIKKKKELKHIDPKFVQSLLEKYPLEVDPNPKSASFKAAVKEIRSQLRRYTGLFQEDKKEQNKLLEKFLQTKNKSLLLDLLKTHASTHERLSFYTKLYKKIITKKLTLLDLGCGLNPLSVILMPHQPTYYAFDIQEDHMNLINQVFQTLDVKGEAKIFNLLELNNYKNLPKADLVFLWKVTDLLEGKGHKMTEKILELLPTKKVVLSFPTKTMTGKNMVAPKRNWVTLLCKRKGYTYEVLHYSTEIFYLISF